MNQYITIQRLDTEASDDNGRQQVTYVDRCSMGADLLDHDIKEKDQAATEVLTYRIATHPDVVRTDRVTDADSGEQYTITAIKRVDHNYSDLLCERIDV